MPKVRLVGADGGMLGVVSIEEALRAAEDAGLDLVEVSPQADPPVCKILDYGKYRYELQKKAKEAKKKQKVINIKEIKLRPTIDPHDLGVKLRAIRKFIEEGDKVKVSLRFRGREASHKELGVALLQKVVTDVEDCTKMESGIQSEGSQLIMMLVPK